MSNNWKRFWIVMLNIFVVIVVNGATISLFVMNWINYESGNLSVSFWDALSNKFAFEQIKDLLNNGTIRWNLPDQYHFYYKWIIWLLMGLGVVLTFTWFKYVWKYFSKKKLVAHQVKEQVKIDETIELKKLIAKSENEVLSDKELKRLEELSKGE